MLTEVKLNEIMDSVMELNDGYTLPCADIYALVNEKITWVGSHYDIYDGLAIARKPEGATALIVDTTGGATPIGGGDVRRVRLVVTYDGMTLASILSFEDDNQRVIDMGEATGALRDALEKAWMR